MAPMRRLGSHVASCVLFACCLAPLDASAFIASGTSQPPAPASPPPATQSRSAQSPAPLGPAALSCANPRLPGSILDGAAARAEESPLPTVDLRAPGATLHLAVASDTNTRDLGLMCVTRLRPEGGMLFEFVRDEVVEFWMKNTLIPLDMLWVAPGGRVTSIYANVPAAMLQTSDEDVARRRARGRYVIELSRGEALRAKIAVGTLLPIGDLKLPPATE